MTGANVRDMAEHWSLPNLLSMFNTSLDEIVSRLEQEDPEGARASAMRMKEAVGRLKRFCKDCDQHIVNGI